MAYKYNYDTEEVQFKETKLPTNRSSLKYWIFSFLTCGFYTIFFFIPFSFDIDKIAPKRDGTKTFNYIAAWVCAWFTGSIALLIWLYHITERIEEALEKRKIDYDFSTDDFWGWHIAASFILIGPFVFFHKLCKAMNLLCADYNERPNIEG